MKPSIVPKPEDLSRLRNLTLIARWVVEGYIAGGLVILAGLYGLWRLERPPFWPNHLAN